MRTGIQLNPASTMQESVHVLDLKFHHGIDDIDAEQWNALNSCGYPFLRHEFLLALEQTGCVAIQTGWTPRHVAAYDNGRLCAALPLYEKTHSMGEFVFDFPGPTPTTAWGSSITPSS